MRVRARVAPVARGVRAGPRADEAARLEVRGAGDAARAAAEEPLRIGEPLCGKKKRKSHQGWWTAHAYVSHRNSIHFFIGVN